ncbi:MAG: T9SS type A sorting domain-containing protein [Bacteroidetes bacterium]|nr:T9SS type A sorting domain-containing protein [Bacteroidota bacterium]
MKTKSLLLLCLTLVSITIFAQSKTYFAVTGEEYGNVNWIAFRQFDAATKTPVRTLYIPTQNNEVVYDAVSGRQIVNNDAQLVTPTATNKTCGCINSKMAAAIAYDAKNNRIFYTQMMGTQLRYLDLNATPPKSYAITTQSLKSFPNQPGEASVITRMTIGSDNYGYALTNDNSHLIRFSLGKKPVITDLGGLMDAKSNGENSVKEAYKSWGGDMIADAKGNLYLFDMQRGVYLINPNTRLATYLGNIKNIPEDYTINAAMVESGGNVIVGSSTNTTNYYRVDLTTLEATVVETNTDKVYNVSDFANANFAFAKGNNSNAVAVTLNKDKVSLYPNPVNNNVIYLRFNNVAKGNYMIQLGDMEGKSLVQKSVNIAGTQTASLATSGMASGVYVVRVVNDKGENLYNGNVVISR